jgi:nucleotide-binding universal stress UspA family protein
MPIGMLARAPRAPKSKRQTTSAGRPYIVVVGVDYSELSLLALRTALRIVPPNTRAEVHAVYVERSEAHGAGSDQALVAAQRRLRSVVTEEVAQYELVQHVLESSCLARVVTHVRRSAPGREIAQLAADLEADLVVVGTHSRNRLARLLLGSVAHEVVTLAPCPVLVVRPKSIPSRVPAIEPACPQCLEARKLSGGRELWCAQHREHHGQRHTVFQGDRVGRETNFPLVFDENR